MGKTLFTLSPASPHSLGFTLGFFRLSWLPRGLEATTNCLHWMTVSEERAAWNERDRIDPERPERAQKEFFTKF